MSEDELPDLMDPDVQRHPYDLYKTLQQRQCPVHKMSSTDFHLVVSDAAARETLRQPDLFLSGVSPMALADGGSVDQEILDIYQNEGWVPLASCSTSDPPRHTKVRGFLEGLFKVERIRRATPMIDRVARDLLEQWQDPSEVAFVRDFAHPFPMIVIANLMGVPDGDMTQFKLWSDAIVEPFSMMASRERRLECARLVVEMQHYFAEMIEARRKTPRDDFISEALSYRSLLALELRHAPVE
jgi:cytochrome P450